MHLHLHSHFTPSLSAFDLYDYAPSSRDRKLSLVFGPSTQPAKLASIASAADTMSRGLVAEGVYVHRDLGSEAPELHYWRSLASFISDGENAFDTSFCVLVLEKRIMLNRPQEGTQSFQPALNRFVASGGIVVSIE